MLYRLDHHATADSLSLMFHVKRGRELIVAWWINKVYHFVDFLENLVKASVFAIKFLIPMNFVLHAQPDPVTRIVLGSFYPKHLVLRATCSRCLCVFSPTCSLHLNQLSMTGASVRVAFHGNRAGW